MHTLKAPKNLPVPVASRLEHTSQHHGTSVTDPYFWLKDQNYPDVNDPQVMAYLEQENNYYNNVMHGKEALTDALFNEIKGRINDVETSVPWIDGAYEYHWAFTNGAQYRTWYRRAFGADRWQVIFDENKAAAGSDYFHLNSLEISPDGNLMAFSSDTSGGERYHIQVKDLTTGRLLADSVDETSGDIVWSASSDGFAFVRLSKEWRPYLVEHHRLGHNKTTPLYEEADTSFFVHIGCSSSRQYLIIRSANHTTAEVSALPTENFADALQCLGTRQTGHDYYVDHADAGFYIRSNKDHQNFGIYLAETTAAPWQTLTLGDRRTYIRAHKLFKNQMIIQESIDGLDHIRVCDLNGGADHHITFPEAACDAGLGHNSQYDQDFVRVTYSSMITPATVFDYDVIQRQLTTRKIQEIPSGYDKSCYKTERLMVPVRDGAEVPVSLVYSRNWRKNNSQPLHLYGYGAYGHGMAPSFSAPRISLLDRGFVYAIAHIRGGDELGRDWYEAGKLEKRTNSFNDFVDVARYLQKTGYAAPGGVSISGGSAGGELIGASVNQDPALFKACVLHVPFVDVLNTMLDVSLPLTPIEWPEWGNPVEDKQAFDLIASYCPYTNIKPQAYPPMMVTGGLNDPRVTYWEPAKWTAKMRHCKTNDTLLVMKINMGAGHGGKSGRFDRYREVAEEYTFLLMAFGLNN